MWFVLLVLSIRLRGCRIHHGACKPSRYSASNCDVFTIAADQINNLVYAAVVSCWPQAKLSLPPPDPLLSPSPAAGGAGGSVSVAAVTPGHVTRGGLGTGDTAPWATRTWSPASGRPRSTPSTRPRRSPAPTGPQVGPAVPGFTVTPYTSLFLIMMLPPSSRVRCPRFRVQCTRYVGYRVF